MEMTESGISPFVKEILNFTDKKTKHKQNLKDFEILHFVNYDHFKTISKLLKE